MTKSVAPELILKDILQNIINNQGSRKSAPRFTNTLDKRDSQQRLINLSQAASNPSDPQGQINALNELAVLNPQAAQVISQSQRQRQQTLGDLQKAKTDKAKNDIAFAASYGRAIKNAKTDSQKDTVYQNFLKGAAAAGLELDPNTTPQNYYEGMEDEYINPIIDQAESLGLVEKSQQPLSPEGKFRADVSKGFLTDEAVSQSEQARIQKGEEFKARGEDIKQKRQDVVFNQEKAMRGSFSALSKEFINLQKSYNRILSSDPTQIKKFMTKGITQFGASDLALIFNYMKILDPNSVVRESEFRVAETSRALLTDKGVPTSLIKGIDKIFAGARLTPEQREDFKDRAKELYKAQLQTHNKLISEFSRIATNKNLDPANIIIDFEHVYEASKGRSPETPQKGAAQQKVRRYNPQTGKIE